VSLADANGGHAVSLDARVAPIGIGSARRVALQLRVLGRQCGRNPIGLYW
jgi:hypothetical protein